MASSVNKKEVEHSHFKWTSKTSNNNEEDDGKSKSNSRKLHGLALVFRLRSLFGKNSNKRVMIGTLFGNKRGHVHLSFQKDSKSDPSLLIQLATPITGLVREMGCGTIRITLESEKREKRSDLALVEERVWQTYYNGVKCGTATRMECGDKERKILKVVEPISMGAGVLPAVADGDEEEVIYMRSKFERVIGSSDSEAFYMLNPDNNGTAPPELSIYLLRIL
ncbi:protein MIZU-KUSSEI 1-like [Salvia hispanica]|uniref:protein MIZU-KUSSEI 1-like n=1 Tax=Salvia hispanica TaxID=49212 RepID=UPI002008FEDB|nr:protein MIZU-KUSSEI 1-like [Salvia hispanica]